MVGFATLFVTETRSVCGSAFCSRWRESTSRFRALEPAITADLVPDRAIRGTAMGMLATVNGLGDFVASVGVGVLFALGPQVGFAVAAGLMLTGALLLAARKV